MNNAATINDTIVVRLTDAQRSALECSGIDLDDESPELLAAWNGASVLRANRATINALCGEITDVANSEDDIALRETDPEMRRLARGARTALTNLARNIRKASRS